jgi:hypothetical protein
MHSGVTLILSAAGALCATSSLASGEALRTDDAPFFRRVTARMLLSLAFLGAAVVGGALELLRAPAIPSGAWLSPLLLAAGAWAALRAYVGAPRRRGNETFAERLTPRGQYALGLLAAALLVDLSGGRLPSTSRQFQTFADNSNSTLVVLGMVLTGLGAGAAAATFRAGSPLLPGTGPLPQRLRPLAKGTVALLGLALAAVGLASYLSPSAGMLLCLLVLALGITTGGFALFFAARPGWQDAPGPCGISPRGWVSLALLALAVGLLAAHEGQLLGPLGGMTSPDGRPPGTATREPGGAVGDPLSLWSQGSPEAPATPSPAEAGGPLSSPSIVDVSKWHHPKP